MYKVVGVVAEVVVELACSERVFKYVYILLLLYNN